MASLARHLHPLQEGGWGPGLGAREGVLKNRVAQGRALLWAFAHPQNRKTKSSTQLVCGRLGGDEVEDCSPCGAPGSDLDLLGD